jgi:hypothetical protein
MAGGASYPDFLGIGAQKAGTTWLSRNLQAHPEIWMPSIKEVHYFDEQIGQPASLALRLYGRLFGKRDADRRWRRQVRARSRRHLRRRSRDALLWDIRYYLGAPNDAWYASLFEPGRGMVAGEITPAYSTLGPDAIAHVRGLMPEARIIFMMRNPMERAFSQAVMHFDKASKRDIEGVGDRKLSRIFEREGYRSRTDYLRTLESWGSFYPPERIFVGFLEDIHFFPEELLGRVYEFLGVDPSFRPPGVGRKVHSRSAGAIPARALVYLARSYHDELRELDERFGGYASFWLYCAQCLIEDPPEDGSLPYPLWESRLWEEWRGNGRMDARSPSLQSAPFSVQACG